MSSAQELTNSRSKGEKEDVDVQSGVANVPDLSQDVFEGTLDPVYEAKAKILNDAIQEIGMGRYQVPTPTHVILILDSFNSAVAPFLRRGLWMVFVRIHVLISITGMLIQYAYSDNLWPVSNLGMI